MLKNGRGVLCAPITEERCQELELDMQVANNTSLLGTPFTITVDKLGGGCTTGVSMFDRAETILALADPKTKPSDLGRPGHINPLRARSRGVLRRAGHTEAAVDLARLAGLYPAGALIEIINEDGTMARLPQLIEVAKKFDIKIICIKDLISYRLKTESIVENGVEVDLPTQYGHFRLIPFRQKSNGLEHIALIKGRFEPDEPILVRVHSSCATGDIFGSMRCECGEQLHKAMQRIEQEGKGVIVYLNQEGRGIGLMEKMKAYKLQEDGLDCRCKFASRTSGRRTRLRRRCPDPAPFGSHQDAPDDQQPRQACRTGSIRADSRRKRSHRSRSESLQRILHENEKGTYGTRLAQYQIIHNHIITLS